MKSKFKVCCILLNILITGISLSADQINTQKESDEYPKGYYNDDRLPEKTAYLTFDDGPSEWTEGILDVIKKENVKATFFISAYWNNRKMIGPNSFQKQKRALLRIVREGHVLGNHTSGHKILTRLSPGEIRKEFNFNQNLLNKILGKEAPAMTILRMPLGVPWSKNHSISKKKYVGSIVRKIGIVAMWSGDLDSTDSWDWAKGEWYKSDPRIDEKNPSFIHKKERVYNKIVSHADGKGIVILMHDTHLVTRDVLSSVITELKRRGYRFCTMEDFVSWKYGKSSLELLGKKVNKAPLRPKL